MSNTKSGKYDLTEGGILDKLVLISLPVIGTQVIQMTYNLADMFWLGRIGANAVAASGAVGMYMWLSMAFLMFGRLGAEIGVSQSFGRGDLPGAQRFGENAVQLGTVLGVLFGLVMLLGARPLVGFFNFKDPGVIRDAEAYMRIVALGMPFFFLTAAVTGVYNGSGNSRVPFVINAVGLVLNMVLDPLLIFTFDMGIPGAAIATIAAQIVACILSVLSLLVYKNRPFSGFSFLRRPDPVRLRMIFKWAAPTAVESFLFCFLSMATNRMIAFWGEAAFAAQRVGSQIESLSWLIGGGYSMALTSFVGQNFGARQTERIRKSVRLSTGVMLIWGVIITAAMFFGGRLLMGIFVPGEAEVIEIGARFIRIVAACQIIACLEGVAAGAFRGAGRTVPPSIVSVSANVLRVAAAYLLSRTSLGLTGIFWAISGGAALRGIWMYVWYAASQRGAIAAGPPERL